jgi:hypothetical protein
MSATFDNASDDSPVSPMGGPWENHSHTKYSRPSPVASISSPITPGSTGSSPNRSFSFDLPTSPCVPPVTSLGDFSDDTSYKGGSPHSHISGQYTCSTSQYITDNTPPSPVLHDLSQFDPRAASKPLNDLSFYSYNPGHTSAQSFPSSGFPTGVPSRKLVPTYTISRPTSSMTSSIRFNSYAASSLYRDTDSLDLVTIDREEYPESPSTKTNDLQSRFTSLARYVKRKGETFFTNATKMTGSMFPTLKH